MMTGMNMRTWVKILTKTVLLFEKAIIDRELYKRKIDIAVLQETRLTGSVLLKKKFTYFSGLVKP